jgi:hypothetical protein
MRKPPPPETIVTPAPAVIVVFPAPIWVRSTGVPSGKAPLMRNQGIPKKSGGVRMLGVPTVWSRCGSKPRLDPIKRALTPIVMTPLPGGRPACRCWARRVARKWRPEQHLAKKAPARARRDEATRAGCGAPPSRHSTGTGKESWNPEPRFGKESNSTSRID